MTDQKSKVGLGDVTGHEASNVLATRYEVSALLNSVPGDFCGVGQIPTRSLCLDSRAAKPSPVQAAAVICQWLVALYPTGTTPLAFPLPFVARTRLKHGGRADKGVI